MGNIAVTYCALGMKQDSLAYLEQTLQSLQIALPHDHPDTGDKHVSFDYLVKVALDLILCAVAAMENLAGSYFAFRRHADAVVLRETVLEIRHRKLPEDHPDTGNNHVCHSVVATDNVSVCSQSDGQPCHLVQ